MSGLKKITMLTTMSQINLSNINMFSTILGTRKIVSVPAEKQDGSGMKRKIKKKVKPGKIIVRQLRQSKPKEEIAGIEKTWTLESDCSQDTEDYNLDNYLFGVTNEDEAATESNTPDNATNTNKTPTIEILEQPEPSYRLRYCSENNVVSLLMGEHSTPENKTYIKIQMSDYDKNTWIKAEVFVSCVVHDEDPFPSVHPNKIRNNIRGRGNSCTNGVCAKTFDQNGVAELRDIGIQRITVKEIIASLEERKIMGIDPFNRGYEQGSYNGEVVKLCFQVRLTDVDGNTDWLAPVTSNTIAHAKSKEMTISSLAPIEAPSDTPVKMIILADNLPHPGDISVIFSTPDWTEEVNPFHQHHNCALEVFTPKLDKKFLHKTKVSIQLVRKTNNAKTNFVDFFLLPPMEICQNIQLQTKSQDLQEGHPVQEATIQMGQHINKIPSHNFQPYSTSDVKTSGEDKEATHNAKFGDLFTSTEALESYWSVLELEKEFLTSFDVSKLDGLEHIDIVTDTTESFIFNQN